MLNDTHNNVVMQYICKKHFHPHGLRKGSASFASSGTTCAPSIPSICNRSEWSMGKVLDVYWHFCNEGNHYLGRVLCGLDPNNETFSTLPPHFTVTGDLMSDPDIALAMDIMYRPIMEAYKDQVKLDPTGLLLLLLVSIVYHLDWLISETRTQPGHPFTHLAVLNNRPLKVRTRKKLVFLLLFYLCFTFVLHVLNLCYIIRSVLKEVIKLKTLLGYLIPFVTLIILLENNY